MAEGRFEIPLVGPYSLASSAKFLEGFAPAAYEGDGADHLRLAFMADGFAGGSEVVAGVYAYPEGDVVVKECTARRTLGWCGGRSRGSFRWTWTGAVSRRWGCGIR